MEGAFFVIVAIGFVVVAGLVAYANHLAAQRRREGMARLASARGWTYVERDDSWVNRFHDAPFGIGFSQKAVNVVRGEHDHRKFVAFDYWYSTREGSGKSRRTVRHVCSVIAITTTGVLPDLRVMPENMFSRLVTRITNSDIELESEQFNRAFTITCDDRKFATDVLHPQMMELLLTMPDLGWSLQSGTLLVASEGEHGVARIDAVLDAIDRIIDLFPGFVWDQAGIDDPGAPEI